MRERQPFVAMRTDAAIQARTDAIVRAWKEDKTFIRR